LIGSELRRENFGKELILDLHNCNAELFTRKSIKKFFVELCELIDMEREKLSWWDYQGQPEEYEKAPSHLKGITAVQFIKTSNITIHTLDVQKKVFLNVFSCKDFDHSVVVEFCEKWFKGVAMNRLLTDRL
jgi:S-adenosylmethionine/arginine decarboxylase-like enzyme